MEPRADTVARLAGRRVARLFAYRTLLKYLVLKDLKVRSRGTYLGIAWTLVNPLLTLVMYVVVLKHVFRVGIPNFVSFFLVGLLMWMFFSRCMSKATTCILENEALVKESVFPLEILPLTVVVYHACHHAIALGIALPIMVVLGGAQISWNLLWFLATMVAFTLFTVAVSLWLATVGVFFRDARDILEVGLPVLFWGTPIAYTPDMAPRMLRPLLAANPLTSFIGSVRAALLSGQMPSPTDLAWVAAWMVVMLCSGVWVFARYGPRFAEEV